MGATCGGQEIGLGAEARGWGQGKGADGGGQRRGTVRGEGESETELPKCFPQLFICQSISYRPAPALLLLTVLPCHTPACSFPMPLDATSQDNVFVGRVRRDLSRDDNKGLDLFVCGDQIKKGAALNAVQIAELVLKN